MRSARLACRVVALPGLSAARARGVHCPSGGPVARGQRETDEAGRVDRRSWAGDRAEELLKAQSSSVQRLLGGPTAGADEDGEQALSCARHSDRHRGPRPDVLATRSGNTVYEQVIRGGCRKGPEPVVASATESVDTGAPHRL